MRHRRAERCLVRADLALQAGLLDEARAATDEARELDPDSAAVLDMDAKLSVASDGPTTTDLPLQVELPAIPAVNRDRAEKGRRVQYPLAFALALASLALVAAASLGWRAVLSPAVPAPVNAALRGDVTLPADPVLDSEPAPLSPATSSDAPTGAALAEAEPEPSAISTSGVPAAQTPAITETRREQPSPAPIQAPPSRPERSVTSAAAPNRPAWPGEIRSSTPAPSASAPSSKASGPASNATAPRSNASAPTPNANGRSTTASAPSTASGPSANASAPRSYASAPPPSEPAIRSPREEAPPAPAVRAPALESAPLSASLLPAPNSVAVAAPEAPAPLRSRAPEPAAPIIEAQSAIRATLARYAAAYSGLNVAAARAVWPAVDERALARAFDNLASQRVALGSCDITVGGTTAHATCSGTAEWTPKVGGGQRRQNRRWAFDLANANGAWQIVRADAR